MVVMTSVNEGLVVPAPPELPPAAAAPMADIPVTARAAAAIPAATYETAGTLTVFPFSTADVMHATLSPVSSAFSSSVAWAAISGIENAMDGIWFAYSEGMACSPFAAKDPTGTGHN